MDQTIDTARDGAALLRRVVLRALTVLGGAAAGTAIAWCVSTANASADPADAGTPLDPEIPIVTPVSGALQDTVHGSLESPLAGTSGLRDRLRDSVPTHSVPTHSVTDLGERITTAADGFGEHATQQLPECANPLCGSGHVGRSEAPAAGDGAGSGRSDSPSPAPVAVLPAGAGKVATTGVDPGDLAEHTATGRAHSDGMSRRGSPAPGMPSFPDLPAPLAPTAPAPAPSHNGSAGNPADSSLFAALPWQDRMPALLRGLTVPAAEAVTVGHPGAQPGVTPD